MIKKLLLVALCFIVGMLVFSYMSNPSTFLVDLTSKAQSLFTWATNNLGITLSALGTVAMAGITVVTNYFKNRTITQQSQQVNALETSLTQASISNESLTQKLGIAEQTEQFGKTASDKIAGLATELNNTQTTLETKVKELADWENKESQWHETRIRLEDERNFLNTKIKQLQYDLDVATGKITPPVK